MISYLLLSCLGTLLFFAIYQLLLKNEKWFQFNRFYLITSLCIALLLPALNFDLGLQVDQDNAIISQTKQFFESVPNPEKTGTASTTIKPQSQLFQNALLLVYALGLLLFLSRFLYQVAWLFRSIKQAHQKLADFKLITLKKRKGAFSFFNYLFINQEKLQDEKSLPTLLLHENVHQKQFHSLDNLFFEFVKVLFWFNPMIWLYAKAAKQNHEYIADEACQKKVDVKEYQNLILNFAQSRVPSSLLSSFSFPTLKNRFTMMNKKKSLQNRLWKGSLLLLSTIAFGALSSFQYVAKEKPMVVVIDPGHGGKDLGVSTAGLAEKDIVLLISKELEKQAIGQNIKLVFTRTSDQFLELGNRVNILTESQADFYLSLHINAVQGEKKVHEAKEGIEIYFSNQLIKSDTLPNYFVAEKFAQSFSNELDQKVHFKPAPFFVLKMAKCPAILLECGFLTNENDRKKLQDPTHHEKLAKAILTSIRELKSS
ncbi:MAG: N-acetylmuramoyl-L-alanine amidase [Vicingaceae bacterium]